MRKFKLGLSRNPDVRLQASGYRFMLCSGLNGCTFVLFHTHLDEREASASWEYPDGYNTERLFSELLEWAKGDGCDFIVPKLLIDKDGVVRVIPKRNGSGQGRVNRVDADGLFPDFKRQLVEALEPLFEPEQPDRDGQTIIFEGVEYTLRRR